MIKISKGTVKIYPVKPLRTPQNSRVTIPRKEHIPSILSYTETFAPGQGQAGAEDTPQHTPAGKEAEMSL